MSRTIDAISDFQSFQNDDPTPAQLVQEQLRGKAVCPFCGTTAENAGVPCARCTMENSPLTRQATKARLGPWYVLQTRNPSAPGMKYSVLLSLVKKGQVTPRSIIRGPTTNQFWRFAARVKGLSRAFGICWGCGTDIEPTVDTCPHCQRSQLPPADPDQLMDGRQPLSQVLPVRREIRPAFSGESAGVQDRPPRKQPPPPAQNEMPLRHASAREGRAREAVSRETASRETGSREGVSRENAASERRAPTGVEPARETLLSPKPSLPARPGPQPMLTQGQLVVLPKPLDPEPQQPLAKIMLLLVLVAAFTVAAWLYVDQGARAQVFGWVKAQWNNLSADSAEAPPGRTDLEPMPGLKGEKIVTAPSAPETPVRPTKPRETEASRDPAPTDSAQAAAPPPAEPEDMAGMKLAEVVPWTPPIPVPATQEQEAAPAEPTPPPVVEIQVDQAPRAPAPRPDPRPRQPEARQPAAPQGTAEVSVSGDLNEALRQSRKLYTQAVDAEAAGNYDKAVSLYEEIERLPPAAWPGDLMVRIKLARGQLRE